MRRLRTSLLAASLLLLACAAQAAAQEVHGQVLDERTDDALPAVQVTLLDAAGRRVAATRTDERGAFALRVPAEGQYRLQAEGINYGPRTELLQVGGKVSLRLVMRLPLREVTLDALTVIAQGRDRDLALEIRGLDGFPARRQYGRGIFMTREEIERRNPMEMTAVVRMLPGVLVVPSDPSARGGDVMMRGSQCLPSVWVDGALVRPGAYRPPVRLQRRASPSYASLSLWMSFDELVEPDDVEALEVYRSALEVPAVFAGSNPSCGALVVWRRTGDSASVLQAAMTQSGVGEPRR